MARVGVVGGGIFGLFVARHLAREGTEVTVFEEGPAGAGSVHAAGIIEPTTAYRTNTFAFLRHVGRLWTHRTTTFRSVDPRWLVESARQMGRAAFPGSEEALHAIGVACLRQYRALADEADDFGFAARGLLERYDDPITFAEARRTAVERASRVPVELRDGEWGAGSLYFPEVAWVDTERTVDRLVRELPAGTLVRARVERVGADGSLWVGGSERRFDSVVLCAGVACRRAGVPLTGVRGYGWTVRSRTPVETATIYVDRGIAVVPLAGGLKTTGGWDFDLGTSPWHASSIEGAIRRVVAVDQIGHRQQGSRPCTPDGLPTVGRRDHLVAATGGFRLGWSFAPELGRLAARLAAGQGENDPFLSRFCGDLHAAVL